MTPFSLPFLMRRRAVLKIFSIPHDNHKSEKALQPKPGPIQDEHSQAHISRHPFQDTYFKRCEACSDACFKTCISRHIFQDIQFKTFQHAFQDSPVDCIFQDMHKAYDISASTLLRTHRHKFQDTYFKTQLPIHTL